METAPKPARKKVLIIEDEGDMSLLMHIILAGRNMQLDNAKKLSDALNVIREEKPDIVLLDNKLPDGFGIDFLGVIKRMSPHTKIIMITGYDPSAGDVALETGADLFLTKPFTKDQLTSAVNSLMNDGVLQQQ